MSRLALVFLAIVLLAPFANAETQVSGQTSPWRLTKVIGVNVYNGNNEKIGQTTISLSMFMAK